MHLAYDYHIKNNHIIISFNNYLNFLYHILNDSFHLQNFKTVNTLINFMVFLMDTYHTNLVNTYLKQFRN